MSAGRETAERGAVPGWLRRHRPGPTALLWAGSVALLVADVLAADLVPGSTHLWHTTAAVLAIGSVILFLIAAAIGVRCLVRHRMRSAWIRRHKPGTPYPVDDEVIAREAARGITALEVFLARQKHTH
ncbi:MAG: hypothetical protein QOF82_1962 [Frankiales bacterium]|jgi:hypothetical protein|nr:hypothetical protein [Frankiales bacterium]